MDVCLLYQAGLFCRKPPGPFLHSNYSNDRHYPLLSTCISNAFALSIRKHTFINFMANRMGKIIISIPGSRSKRLYARTNESEKILFKKDR